MASAEMPQKLGRYEIVRVLGKGAMGVVYEGRDPNIGRRVAIKTARRDVIEASGIADEMMERFLREAQAAGALNHPNIITIYDADEQDGITYIAMEYLEGSDLLDALQHRQSFSMEDIVEIGATVCEALAVAHDHGVVHRDVKPANIMLPGNAPLKIADFGIARISDSNLTQEGALIGTPHYMSPEQFMGQKVDGRSDLFSVAIMLYEMLTGEKPFSGEALSTVMHHVIKNMPSPPTELNLSVPDALGAVIMKALSKRPADRYQDGRALAAALRESLKTKPESGVLGVPVPGADETHHRKIDPDQATRVLPPGQITGGDSETNAETGIPKPPAPTPAPASKPQPSMPGKKSNFAAILGIVAVAALALAGIFAWMEGGSKPPGQDPAAATAPAEEAPYFARASFDVFRARSIATIERYDDSGGNWEVIKSEVDAVPQADFLEIRQGDTLLERREPYTSGDVILLQGKPEELSVTVGLDGKTDQKTILNPDRPGCLAARKVIFAPPSQH